MKYVQTLMLCALVLGTCTALTQAKDAPKQNNADMHQAAETHPATHTHSANSERGQQVFAQNCSRCHNSPEGFSPHISGTIARHMRIRAGLSDDDYKALRQFLIP